MLTETYGQGRQDAGGLRGLSSRASLELLRPVAITRVTTLVYSYFLTLSDEMREAQQ
jgi:hypothetical protein